MFAKYEIVEKSITVTNNKLRANYRATVPHKMNSGFVPRVVRARLTKDYEEFLEATTVTPTYVEFDISTIGDCDEVYSIEFVADNVPALEVIKPLPAEVQTGVKYEVIVKCNHPWFSMVDEGMFIDTKGFVLLIALGNEHNLGANRNNISTKAYDAKTKTVKYEVWFEDRLTVIGHSNARYFMCQKYEYADPEYKLPELWWRKEGIYAYCPTDYPVFISRVHKNKTTVIEIEGRCVLCDNAWLFLDNKSNLFTVGEPHVLRLQHDMDTHLFRSEMTMEGRFYYLDNGVARYYKVNMEVLSNSELQLTIPSNMPHITKAEYFILKAYLKGKEIGSSGYYNCIVHKK